ncbi:MAG: DUF86 domain-containing protein [Candidatus Thermoplasmatota archaeon]|nr:DUF86 domain-containing protein [Candidatus Thermoplasmatota archaeon]
MRIDIIQTKIKEIEENLKIIKEHLPENFDEFSTLGLIKDGIYKRIESSIENIIDICAIINTDLDLAIPESDESILDNLNKECILSDEMTDALKNMKGFRNILVHRYAYTDDKIAYSVIKENLDDVYKFIDVIEEFIEKRNE